MIEVYQQEDLDQLEHYLDKPDECVKDLFASWFIEDKGEDRRKWIDNWAVEALYAVKEYNFVAITGANAVGKTAFAIFVKYWFLLTRWMPAVQVTSIDQIQLHRVFWAESRRWYDRSPDLQVMFEHMPTRIVHREHREVWFAIARTAKKQIPAGEEAQATGLQGLHAPHLFFIIDEASGVEDPNWEAAESSIRQPDNHLLAISNPLRVSGKMFQIFNLSSFKKYWYTKEVSYKDSSLIDQKLAEQQIEALGGEKAPVVQIRFLGRFPKRGGINTLPTYEQVQRAIERGYEVDLNAVNVLLQAMTALKKGNVVCEYTKEELIEFKSALEAMRKDDRPDTEVLYRSLIAKGGGDIVDRWNLIRQAYYEPPTRLGVDIARFGDSETAFAFRRNWRIIKCEGFHALTGTDIQGRVKNAFDVFTGLEIAIIDSTGIAGGIGVVDPLVNEGYSVIELGFGSPSTDKHRYYNMAAELWMFISDNSDKVILPDSDILISQFTSRRYFYTGKTAQQVRIESKDDMKKRKLPSPDHPDSCCLSYAPIVIEEEGDYENDGTTIIEEEILMPEVEGEFGV